MTYNDSLVCPFCQTEIAADATACPGCQAYKRIQIHGRVNGTKQPHQMKARSWVFHGLGIVGIVFMLESMLSGASDWWLGLVVAAFCFALGVFYGKAADGEQRWFRPQEKLKNTLPFSTIVMSIPPPKSPHERDARY